MKQCLADVNVLLPLLVRHHEHHRMALRWFEGLHASQAVLCRFVQLALVRLLGNRTIMREFVLSATSAWQLIEDLIEDERLEFAPEPASLGSALPGLLIYSVPPTNKLLADAYLAAFAIAGSLRLSTFDKGFEQFRGLELELLDCATL
jgi:toxin-antitoxin system PIN domain toxin